MLQLTQYQEQALESLRTYLKICDTRKDANLAFYEATMQVWGQGIPYRPVPVSELSEIPYICLRLPTGGGKTLLACHAIAVANEEYLKCENSVVLWLVPSNAIKEQTVSALKDRSHHYRHALDSELGNITVIGIEEALYLQKSTVTGSTTIIVSTLQAFRVEEKEGRKVYESSGELKHHFDNLPQEIVSKLERNESGVIPYSLSNVLRIHRPLVIVDEAHNARTALSFDTLARFRPSAIIEFTATPATNENPSNVLHSVSAAELKAENMIKLPIRLEVKSEWQSVLADAIAQRKDLEAKALIERQKTGQYIRPLMLLQAQKKSANQETLTFDELKKALIEEHKIPEKEIAIATGDKREIEGIDLLSENCEIRFIITVQALKEGWDCPFAYVLCSVHDMRSSTSVEQILGRILRLPYCEPKQISDLNKAYAFVSSHSFAETAKALVDALVESNGFDRQEAHEFISMKQDDLPEFSLADTMHRAIKPKTIQLSEVPLPKNLPKNLRDKLDIDTKKRTVTIKELLSPEESQTFKENLLLEDSQSQWDDNVREHIEENSEIFVAPSEQHIVFEIPVLCVKQDDLFERFEEQNLMDYGWELSQFDARLSEEEYCKLTEEISDTGEIDIDESAGKLRGKFIPELNQEMMLITVTEDAWTEGEFIHWLDKNLIYYELTPDDKEKFLIALVNDLIDKRNISIAQLVRKRFQLRKIVENKIKQYQKEARGKAYQELLFGDKALDVLVDSTQNFAYHPDNYPARTVCSLSHLFRKHYYPAVGELKESGEEFQCAQYIDNLDDVEFWVRNLERQPQLSFWLQTATDKFYPDFVGKLKDGRLLVVEYKGENLASNDDSKEKRRIGELWAAKSNGKCLFVMPNGFRTEEILAKIKRD